MRKRVYVMEFCDTVDTSAKIFLEKLGATVLIDSIDDMYELPDEYRGTDVQVIAVLVCENSPHLFPSKHIRVLPSCEAADAKGFIIPYWVKHYAGSSGISCIIINGTRDGFSTALETALTNAHFRDENGKWVGKKRKRASRLSVLAAHRSERRQNYMLS